ncbi:MAG: acyltransferase [Oscillospiraceae bacterium]|nr:acyltransferase [Oscillospiraceae bacterium]
MDLSRISQRRTEIMGFACLYVIAFHNIIDWPRLFHPLELFCSTGIGVEVFMLLSGVGLYYSYSKTENTPGFLKKRFVRLLVPYTLIALPFFIWNHILGRGNVFLTFTNIAFPLQGAKTTWFIAAISVFYLIYPFVYKLQKYETRIAGRTISDTGVTIFLCSVWFVILLILRKMTPTFYKNCEIALTRFIVFLLGCWLGKYIKEGRKISGAVPFLFIAIFFVYIYLFHVEVKIPAFWRRMIHVPLAFGGLFLFYYLSVLFDRLHLKKIIEFFGKRSLEIYLSHVLLLKIYQYYVGPKRFDRWDLVGYLIVIIVSVAVSSVIHPLANRICAGLLSLGKKKTVEKGSPER